MRGLLLKDFYMILKYCRSYVFITVVFIAMSFFADGNMFFTFYPGILVGMLPVNLMAYDEHSRWIKYSGVLPITKAQLVSSKYIVSLICQVAVISVTAISQAVRIAIRGDFYLVSYVAVISVTFIMAVFATSICLPFVFKYGVEKGRLFHLLIIGAVCGMGAIVGTMTHENTMDLNFSGSIILPIFCLVTIGLYALSWYMSLVFFAKREI